MKVYLLIFALILLTYPSYTPAQDPRFTPIERLDAGDLKVHIYPNNWGFIGQPFVRKDDYDYCESWSCVKRVNRSAWGTLKNGLEEDKWVFSNNIDPMTDQVYYQLWRMPHEIIRNKGVQAKDTEIGLLFQLTKADMELLCIKGHDYPKKIAIFRIDKNKAQNTSIVGCTLLTPEIEEQLLYGTSIVVRGTNLPLSTPETHEISLDGYRDAVAYIRSIRDK